MRAKRSLHSQKLKNQNICPYDYRRKLEEYLPLDGAFHLYARLLGHTHVCQCTLYASTWPMPSLVNLKKVSCLFTFFWEMTVVYLHSLKIWHLFTYVLKNDDTCLFTFFEKWQLWFTIWIHLGKLGTGRGPIVHMYMHMCLTFHFFTLILFCRSPFLQRCNAFSIQRFRPRMPRVDTPIRTWVISWPCI